MARSKINYQESISILGLNSGASSEEIKSAYRRLAKNYHPDVYKLDDGEKFKEISLAFSFLKKYPAPPVQAQNQAHRPTTVNDYERRRRAYHQRNKEKKAKESVLKAEMYKWLFARIRLFAFIILIFNSLLLIDYCLPSVSEEVKISRMNTVRKFSRYSSGKPNSNYSYEAKLSNGMSFRFGRQGIDKMDVNSPFILKRSMIFKEGEALISKKEDLILFKEYGIFRIFGFLIPVAIVLIMAYLFFVKNNDYRLTMFLIAAVIFVVQLVLVF